MSKVIKLKKGLDIKLEGKPEATLQAVPACEFYALKPTDFHGFTPKMKVGLGDEVKAGTPLFADKYQPELNVCSPVSGKVVAINLGERRRLMEVVVEAKGDEYVDFSPRNPLQMQASEIEALLLESGCWPFIQQRPFAVMAKPGVAPKHVYISAFDSAPLAADYHFVLKSEKAAFQAGVNALSQLTTGKVRIGYDADAPTNPVLEGLSNAELYGFSGPHPKSSVGVEIHHIEPINKGDMVWYVAPQDVVIIGRLFLEGRFRTDKIVALTGSQVIAPQYYQTKIGASMSSLVSGKMKAGENRVISGNVLTGEAVPTSSYLGYYDSQISVIPEGYDSEFLGWGTPGFGKWSMSRTFFSWLSPQKAYNIDTNMRGGHRPFVVSGQYERVVPMDVLPVNLLKAILYDDFDQMEQLGIYEVAEEDFALCEVVCTSKTEVQKILRMGLDKVRKEMS